MKPSAIELGILENKIRNDGIWAHKGADLSFRHCFICRNPKAHTAISLCGQVIARFDEIHEDTISKKCMVCDLFYGEGKEVIDRQAITLGILQSKKEETLGQDQPIQDNPKQE